MSERIRALDGLRGVAILFVVGSHALTSLIPGLFGVTLFFFISGFIITKLLLESGSDRLAPFYVRRFFRLTPTLVIYIAACVLALWLLDGHIAIQDIAASLLYYASFHDFTMPSLKVTWSLAVEEHFYMLYPLVLVAFRRRMDRLQVALCVCLAACLAWRLVLVLGIGVNDFRTARGTDTRLDSLAYGCLLSVLIHRAPQVPSAMRILQLLAKREAFVGGCLLLIASLAIRNEVFRQTVRFSVQGLAFMPLFCALFWSNSAPKMLTRVLESRLLTYIGAVSYSLYLYHELGLIFSAHLPLAKPLGVVVALAIGVVTTLASYYVIETPGRRFGAKLARSLERRQPALVTQPGLQ